jgi:hypothetical protein
VRQRTEPSKPLRGEFGHTLLPALRSPEGRRPAPAPPARYRSSPRSSTRLVVGVDVAAIPNEDACRLIASLDPSEVHAQFMPPCVTHVLREGVPIARPRILAVSATVGVRSVRSVS